MWSGIWPPSNPKTETPSRLFWPFWPRPAVLPSPEPMPRPTRTRLWRAPGLSRISLSFIVCTRFRYRRANELFAHRHHMSHLADHAADLGAILKLAATVHLVEAEPDQRRPLIFRPADRRAGLGDLDHFRLALGHRD